MDRRTFDGFAQSCVPGLIPAHGFLSSLSDRIPALASKLAELEDDGRLYSGKVRDRIDLGDDLLLFTSDRVSAFDVILGLVPCKGEVLNRLSEFWFNKTADIIPNHMVRRVGGRGMVCKKAKVLPIEVVVRGYLTGSAWRDYENGLAISGLTLPQGLRRDQRFDTPIITPSTKEDLGSHDQPIAAAEIVKKGIVAPDIWARIEETAVALFLRGQKIVGEQGLILVDTKYEFGLIDGELYLVDELHTPDSSRFWYADTYQELFEAGKDQRKLDKEYLRSWLIEHGWSGKGPVPTIPPDVFQELGWRYVQAWQEITGTNFVPEAPSVEAEASGIQSLL